MKRNASAVSSRTTREAGKKRLGETSCSHYLGKETRAAAPVKDVKKEPEPVTNRPHAGAAQWGESQNQATGDILAGGDESSSLMDQVTVPRSQDRAGKLVRGEKKKEGNGRVTFLFTGGEGTT